MDNNGNSEIVSLYLDDIIPNRFQPREVFDDQTLKELAVSIKEHGVIQPIIVRKVDDKYEIIAGERRYKASTMAGLTKIPAIVKNLDDKESSKVALIENLQRRDLTPIEEARTYQKILELEDNMTQEQLAATLGKTQSSVSNKIRLLSLPDEIQDALLKEKISERHARSLLNIDDKNDQIKMMEKIISDKMTVRELDKEIKDMKNGVVSEPENETNIEIGNSIPAVATITPVLSNDVVETPSLEMPTVAENMTANDIVGDIPTSSSNPADLLNANNNSNSAIPSFNFASIGGEESTEAPTSAVIEPNPTVVDINRIRENSVDIMGNNIFKNDNVMPTNEDTNNNGSPKDDDSSNTNDSFKFVPSFNIESSNSNIQPEQSTEVVTNRFSNFFNTNVNNEGTQNPSDTLASAISSLNLTVPASSAAPDISSAKDDIKNVITSLKDKGYNISFEEVDEVTNYKIIISLQK